jgi:hypothetical protein
MEKAKLKDISLDEEDAALFSLKGDLLLKGKAIKYSILPKLNIVLEETLSRIRKIYGIEVFNNHSIIHSAPNFREKRQNDLKVDYTYAFWGLGASRLPIWEGFKRIDNKPTKIIPFILGYWFDNYGLSVKFDPLRYNLKYTNEANEVFLNFLLKNIEYIQTIQSLSKMFPVFYVDKNVSIIKPFKQIIDDYKKEKNYDIRFVRTIKCPLEYNEFNSLIMSFVLFFPIYYSMLEIAQNKQCPFNDIISKLHYENLFEDYPDIDIENKDLQEPNEKILKNIDETKFVKVGIRWQVFERDDFRCVACGKSSHDGAILHIDHIIPRSTGGKDVMENYQTLCHLCNIGKSNKSNKNLRKK